MGNVISDLAEGASKGLFSGLGSMFKDIRTALTGVDPVKAGGDRGQTDRDGRRNNGGSV